jgi:hypothetical protein
MSGRGKGVMQLPQPSRGRKRRSPPVRLLARFQNMTGQSTRLIALMRWRIRCARRANRTSSLERKVRSSNRDSWKGRTDVWIWVFLPENCQPFQTRARQKFLRCFALKARLRRAVEERLPNQPDRTESNTQKNQRRTAIGNRIPGNSKEAHVGD